ncbi:hypothetical protein GM658_09005 [Pseudoduganella eburnea]|uniref:PPM-type phosphatase domain-containing protein n=1 Tax=Massilia eburnea TaxID=1776165 RepID=A0A6L6QF25_9BURK|nr:protein phosphatase 2C domain-containing protein [Massilia eburnea]MTW10741.1 hypothetical protein [Massilia eburnea]
MMISNTYQNSPGAQEFLAMILDQIVGSQASQASIEELGLAMATHVGLKRERNEDRVAVARIAAPDMETYTVALVCDGVGGSEAGDQAAALAIASIICDLAQQQQSYPTLKDLASLLVRRADDLVRKNLQGRGATTLVMLLATTKGEVVGANVGDSRAYSWDPRPRITQLVQITTDDTFENELKGLPDQGVGLINARGLQGRLSQAIGESGRSADDLRVQSFDKEDFSPGAVLGSDGLWRAAKDFETLVGNSPTPTDAVRRAIVLANWVGGVDNSSMIAITDVEQLCGVSQGRPPTGRRPKEIELWLPSSKVKILTGNWISESRPAPPPRAKQEKQEKQKLKSKKKESREPEAGLQLELEAVDSTGARPKIEVTINEEPKKNW